jgi:hypothetical protein
MLSYPIASAEDIAAEFRPDGRTQTKGALRTLKGLHAMSGGVSGPLRDARGRVRGKTHLYCSLNLDAARAARHDKPELAMRLAAEASKIEQGPDMAKVAECVVAVMSKGEIPRRDLRKSAEGTAVLLKLAKRVDKVRARLLAEELDAEPLSGRVTAIEGSIGVVLIKNLSTTWSVSADDLRDQDSLWVGAPILLRSEHWGRGKTLLTTEPALDPAIGELGVASIATATEVSVYDRPIATRQRPTVVPVALLAREPTIRRPDRISIAD